MVSISENQKDKQAEDIVDRVLAIERDADQLIEGAKAQESVIATEIQEYLKTLRSQTDAAIARELERLSAQIENRAQQEKAALEKERSESIARVAGTAQEVLEDCAREVVTRILSR